jgi:phage gpG-like protein
VGFKFVQPRYAPGPRRLRELKRGDIRRAAAVGIRDALTNLIDERFDDRAAPTGTPWAPRKPPTGAWPILEKTGRMRKSFKVIATSAQVTVTNATEYLKFHQTGTSRMVARPALPTGPDLPPEWERRIDSAVSNAIDRFFKE